MFYKICTIIFLIIITLGVYQFAVIKQILYSLTNNIRVIGEKYLKDK